MIVAYYDEPVTMTHCIQVDRGSGIYLIKHLTTGLVYVGQANNIRKRWNEHKRMLLKGIHHNKVLQMLWDATEDCNFRFEVFMLAPKGLTPLQKQRWLVEQERNKYLDLKANGIVLNEAEPEIVATKEAVVECQSEKAKRIKEHDSHIRIERRKIKVKIEELERYIRPKSRKLNEISVEYHQRCTLLRNMSGWQGLFHGRPSGYNKEEEMKGIAMFLDEINHIEPEVNRVKNEISKLRKEDRDLHGQFTKVAERKLDRIWWNAIGRYPTRELISE